MYRDLVRESLHACAVLEGYSANTRSYEKVRYTQVQGDAQGRLGRKVTYPCVARALLSRKLFYLRGEFRSYFSRGGTRGTGDPYDRSIRVARCESTNVRDAVSQEQPDNVPVMSDK